MSGAYLQSIPTQTHEMFHLFYVGCIIAEKQTGPPGHPKTEGACF